MSPIATNFSRRQSSALPHVEKRPKIAIIFYTTYLHIYKLALEIKKGVEKSGSCEVTLYQVPETLSKAALKKVRAPSKPAVPAATAEILKDADGILFGFPTRYGTLPVQLKTFIDSMGSIWASGIMQGKMAGTFVSAATQHGGQETSIMSFVSILAHFGIIYVPFGYASPKLNLDSEILGGSPWGAAVIAGKDGTRQPSKAELEIAFMQGDIFSKTIARYNTEAPLRIEPHPMIQPKADLNESDDTSNIIESVGESPVLATASTEELIQDIKNHPSPKSLAIGTTTAAVVAAGVGIGATSLASEDKKPTSLDIKLPDVNTNSNRTSTPVGKKKGKKHKANKSEGLAALENGDIDLKDNNAGSVSQVNQVLEEDKVYLDSVATSDASVLLLRNSALDQDESHPVPESIEPQQPIASSRNTVKEENELLKNRSLNQNFGIVDHKDFAIKNADGANLPIGAALASTLASDGDLKPIRANSLGKDDIILGPGGNAGGLRKFSLVKEESAFRNTSREARIIDKPNKVTFISYEDMTSTSFDATSAATLNQNRTFALNLKPDIRPNVVTPSPKSNVRSPDELSQDRSEVSVPVDYDVASAASVTVGTIVDTSPVITSGKSSSEAKSKSSSMLKKISDSGSRRSSGMIAAATITAAGAMAAGIFAAKKSKKGKSERSSTTPAADSVIGTDVGAEMYKNATNRSLNNSIPATDDVIGIDVGTEMYNSEANRGLKQPSSRVLAAPSNITHEEIQVDQDNRKSLVSPNTTANVDLINDQDQHKNLAPTPTVAENLVIAEKDKHSNLVTPTAASGTAGVTDDIVNEKSRHVNLVTPTVAAGASGTATNMVDNSNLAIKNEISPTTPIYSPDVDARGQNASKAFNSDVAVAGITAAAAVTATAALVGAATASKNSGKASEIETRGHEVQVAKSHGIEPAPYKSDTLKSNSYMDTIHLPATATEAASYNSLSNKESYDVKTSNSKNSKASSKKSTTSIRDLFRRLTGKAKKDEFMDM